MKSFESHCNSPNYPLEAAYFYEQGEAAEIVMPLLEAGHIVMPEDVNLLESLALDEEGRQVIAAVASYSFMRHNPLEPEELQMWVGVRKSEDNVHPNVFSVPTHRLPLSYLQGLLNGKAIAESSGEAWHFAPDWADMTHKDYPEVDRVDHVLSSKLGGGFEYKRNAVHVSLASLGYGISGVWGKRAETEPNARDLAEAIFMLHLLVYLEEDVAGELIADELTEYPTAGWKPPEVFAEAWQKKEVELLLPDDIPVQEHLDPMFDLCIHGQCVKAAVRDYLRGITKTHLNTWQELRSSARR